LLALHAQEDLTYGRFGAEITLFKFPEIIDTARMLANRGLLLEVLPILRLAVEMMAWAVAVFDSEDERRAQRLNPQNCIATLRPIYETAGPIYGRLSEFSHWMFVVHSNFLKIDGERLAVLMASCRYRAASLAFSVIVLDIFVEIIIYLYRDAANSLVMSVQGVPTRDNSKKTHQVFDQLATFADSDDFLILKLLLR
jgi:hypothetical protein